MFGSTPQEGDQAARHTQGSAKNKLYFLASSLCETEVGL